MFIPSRGYVRLELKHPPHGVLDRRIGVGTMHVEQVDGIDAQDIQAFGACLFAIGSGAVNLRRGALDKAEFGGDKDLVSPPGALEPLAQELLAISIETWGHIGQQNAK